MGKKLIFAVILLGCAYTVSAMALTLADGTQLNDTVVVNAGHYGVSIREYPFGNGGYQITRTIPWRQLSPRSRTDVRRQFHVFRPQIMPGTPIRFDSVTMTANGSVGWAVQNAWTLPVSPERYGLICIRGLFIPQGGTWFGRVWPTGERAFHRGMPVPVFTSGSLR